VQIVIGKAAVMHQRRILQMMRVGAQLLPFVGRGTGEVSADVSVYRVGLVLQRGKLLAQPGAERLRLLGSGPLLPAVSVAALIRFRTAEAQRAAVACHGIGAAPRLTFGPSRSFGRAGKSLFA
jgi:hypothetical protein